MAFSNPLKWIGALVLAGFFGLFIKWHYTNKEEAVQKAVSVLNEKFIQAQIAQMEANAKKEKALKLSNERIRNDYQKQKDINNDLARANADKLRDYESALASAASGNAAPASGIDDPYRTIANQCARALILLDEHAQGLQAKARALQDYANGLRLDTK